MVPPLQGIIWVFVGICWYLLIVNCFHLLFILVVLPKMTDNPISMWVSVIFSKCLEIGSATAKSRLPKTGRPSESSESPWKSMKVHMWGGHRWLRQKNLKICQDSQRFLSRSGYKTMDPGNPFPQSKTSPEKKTWWMLGMKPHLTGTIHLKSFPGELLSVSKGLRRHLCQVPSGRRFNHCYSRIIWDGGH